MIYRQSAQQMKFGLTHRCESCGKFSWNTDFYDADGNKVSELSLSAQTFGGIGQVFGAKRDDVQARLAGIRSRCRRCGAEWPTFNIGTKRKEVAEPEPQDMAEPPAVPGDAAMPGFLLSETARRMEPLGDEVRTIDNSGSSTQTTRRITLERQWTKTIEVSGAKERTLGGGGELSVHSIVQLNAKAEQTIKQAYGAAEGSVQTYSDSIEMTVPPKTKLELILHWNRIWQEGVLTADDGSGIAMEYKVLVGLTFDQTQRDV